MASSRSTKTARTPPGLHPSTSTTFISSCGQCNDVDNEEMVQCDTCDVWYHFKCVDVNQSIESKDFSCLKCDATANKNRNAFEASSVKSFVSITSSKKKIQLELQKLEEQRVLDKEYLRQKYTILEQAIDDDDNVIEHDINNESERISNWVSNINSEAPPKPTFPTNHLIQPTSTINAAATISQSIMQYATTTQQVPLLSSENNYVSKPPTVFTTAPHNVSSHNYSQPQRNYFATIPNSYAAASHNHQMTSAYFVPPQPVATNANRNIGAHSHNYNQRPYQVQPNTQSSMAQNIYEYPAQHRVQETALNANQLAARQVMPKELPWFNGKPEEWPIFISSFEQSTETCGFSNCENLIRLQKSLKGRAFDAVRSQLLLPQNVPDVIDTLRVLYGRSEVIIHSLLQSIRQQPHLKPDKLDNLISYSLSVRNLCATIEASGLLAHMSNPSLLHELIDKLPTQIKLDWSMYKNTIPVVTLSTFSSWLFQLAKAASDVTMPSNETHTNEFRTERRGGREKHNVNTHAETTFHCNNVTEKHPPRATSTKCIVCQDPNHKILQCSSFQKMTHAQKWKTVKEKHLCRKCLFSHSQFNCKVDIICGKNGCNFRHHQLLHNDSKDTSKPTTSASSTISNNVESNCNTHQQSTQNILFRVIPIILYNKNLTIDTYAFLDEGSSLTMIEDELANELQLDGTPERLCLKWTGDTARIEPHSRRLSLKISGRFPNAIKYNISDVRTVESLQLPIQSMATETLIEKYPHLKGVKLESYQGAVPRILIGIDNWKLGLPLQVREGEWNQPVATKTRLGWTLHGVYRNENSAQQVNLHFQPSSPHKCSCNKDVELHQMVKEFFSLENVGVKTPESVIESKADAKAKSIMERTTIRNGQRYETGLLWKNENTVLPDSFTMALNRLICLERQMIKRPDLAENIRHTITEHVRKGYARKLSKDELSMYHPRTWYLPIFSVTNPNKPNKRRTVWDAAATVNGTSLNSTLLKGPDLLTSLPEVLYRFRERPIALTGDIQEMFHQVLIKEEDQHAQRFLWREQPNQTTPDVYLMQVMTFGATCSPSSALFVKDLNARQFQQSFPRAVVAIIDNHYVDDMLDSVDTIEEAIKLGKEVEMIHKNAGFTIRNWVSNSELVSQSLGESVPEGAKNLSIISECETSKILGMWWRTSSDSFTYLLKYNKVNKDVLFGKRRPTKREVLRTLMSIFDPLGLLASFLIYVKILLQEIWRTTLGWDDHLTDSLYEKWLKWTSVLPQLECLNIPRCYSIHKSTQINEVQLHVFVDASENAYAAVAYFRICSELGVECSLITAKTKVSPQKLLSIPRLELQAALLGSRLASTVCRSHTYNIARRVFWSDSKTVLSWLHSEQRKYRQFVAFRVGEILEATNVNEWRWIPTDLNVADEATKWCKIPEFNLSSRWINGPKFLLEIENTWPTNTGVLENQTNVELKTINYHHEAPTQFSIIQVERFSNWLRLLRTQSYVLRFVHNIKAKYHRSTSITGPITAEEYKKAEILLFRIAQTDAYMDEVHLLQQSTVEPRVKMVRVGRSSSIYNYSPYLDENGVLRVNGRVDAAPNIEIDVKRPIILPKNHHITLLLIAYYHHRFHHHNHETVVNELRQRFQIATLRVMLKKVIKNCQRCKNQRAKPSPPQMAALPKARLASFTRPFTFMGIDYFGPMTVAVGRRSEKRWGVLSTCLTTRAIHIEVAHSLTSDSCILALRNIAARRGLPQEIYSDNGTNFRGAHVELQTEMLKLNKDKLVDETFPGKQIKWFFNPPLTPHMGGAWERLIRSVKSTLSEILFAKTPNDELLRSLLIEAEWIVNSRPLTYIPLNTNEDEAITPNHFLLGSSNGEKPPGNFEDSGMYLRKNWKISQQMANMFWKRWVREYLPDLTRRTKWFERVEPIQEGDLVVIVDEHQPRNCWKRGVVIETTSGRSGQVRRAVVKTSDGVYSRPAVKLAVLDVKPSDESEQFMKFGKPDKHDRHTVGENVANAPS